MALQINKPYIWYRSDTIVPEISIISECSTNFGLSDEGVTVLTLGTELTLTFHIEMGLPERSFIRYALPPGGPFTKVIVMMDLSGVVTGTSTVKPPDSVFYTDNRVPEIVPHIWCKHIMTGILEVHVAAKLQFGQILKGGSYTDNYPTRTRQIDLNVAGGPGGGVSYQTYQLNMNEANDYDPVLDNLVVDIFNEPPSNPARKKKGTGTTQGSEADASQD